MTNNSDVLKYLDDDIAISFGYLDHLYNNTYPGIEAEYVIIVSKSNNLLLSKGGDKTSLLFDQMLLVTGGYFLDLKVLVGDGVFVGLSGNLPRRYIHAENIGEKLTFILNNAIYAHIEEIEALNKEQAVNIAAITKLGFSILIELWAYKKTVNKIPKIISDAVALIENEYQYLQGVDDLADRMGLSKSYIIRLFTVHMGISPGRFMEKYRVQKAKSFLLIDSITIEVAAQLCGFSSANYFSKVFKKCVGTSPSNYIKGNEPQSDIVIPDEFYL